MSLEDYGATVARGDVLAPRIGRMNPPMRKIVEYRDSAHEKGMAFQVKDQI